MKKKLTLLILALLFLSGFVMAYRPLPRKRTRPAGQSLAISNYGTLLGVFDANGKSRFGQLKSGGFQIRYKYHRRTVSLSAIGAEDVKRLQRGKPNIEGHSATITVTTADKALEIASHFVVDETAKTITIVRSFRNISTDPISLQMMTEYVDQKLFVGGQPKLKDPNLVQLALGQIKAAQTPDVECQTSICVDHPRPPCPPFVVCPEINKDVAAQLISGVAARGNQIGLRWKSGEILTVGSPAGPFFIVQVKYPD
jgi:hypothetical protein